MNMMNIQALTGLALTMVMCIAGLIFPSLSRAEVPPLDAMSPERIETATFSLG